MTPTRVVRRRHGLLAALAAVLFLAGLLGAKRRDDGWLLTLGGSSLDLHGSLRVAWQDTWRDCSRVRRLASAELRTQDLPQGDWQLAAVARALEALRDFSPPDSRSARLLAADVWSGAHGGQTNVGVAAADPAASWVTLQAAFDNLEAVAVLVRLTPNGAAVVPEGVWSGTTRPWNPASRIRRFLADRVADAPADLLACLNPAPVFAQPPRPL